MSRKTENKGFTCRHCGAQVEPLENGSFRNHCPFCLYSLHVDIKPGDRKNTCQGLLKPVGIHHAKKGLQIRHKCETCGEERVNIVAEFDRQSDDIDMLIRLMA